MSQNKFKWFVPGDLDGFFGLMIDNLIQILVLSFLLTTLCGVPSEFVYKVILPGTAISLLLGNLFYSWQAHRLARKENRSDVTALPYGINTVSLFAFTFFIILPVYKKTGDYRMAWQVGLMASFLSGLIEMSGSFVAEKIRKVTPRAALLSSLAGIAITFISMDFLVRTFQNPLIAFLPFGVILLQYFARVVFPFRLPGGFVSVVLGTLLAWSAGAWGNPIMDADLLKGAANHIGFYFPTLCVHDLFTAFQFADMREYLAVLIPMGIFNVIGSLQNIESAEASGDSFNTRDSLLANGVGTVVGSFFGSPFPTTIYIGHPGWKALGARAGYSTLNGVFMTIVALFGLLAFIQALIPVEAGMAIVLWIGIVIGSQAFEATPSRHAPAVIIGILPALAGWGVLLIQSTFNYADRLIVEILENAGVKETTHLWMSDVPLSLPFLPYPLGGLLSLSQGFLISSMIWASIAVFVIDRNFKKALIVCFVAAVLASTGFIHGFSLRGNDVISQFEPSMNFFVTSYMLLGILFLLASFFRKETRKV
ncbi:NCS2 family permease [Leptospira borgpetersenii]|uniref:NCS2 family permease n=1 Tax=Leptospira borgpetersenii TaxID=174 RepID=UPI001882CB0B|nr:NCS2 family permease [Leptospira borgpetersenii]MBE8365431.1 NCS2 family permease [Leptospira borgpetersenii serovar Balcanica]MBE8366187.1 NCS2 family permease [Leptospira borgpetersenii serovar Balcanica]MBE8424594.1 NCS2 family permease [Leptospira borgpetersenii serovar Balcanica]MBF3351674.1 NCS2 family permease [Leptospira borgpetersenii serovar Balcanica]